MGQKIETEHCLTQDHDLSNIRWITTVNTDKHKNNSMKQYVKF